MKPAIQTIPPGLIQALTQHASLIKELPNAVGLDKPRSGKWEKVRGIYVKAHPNCEACGVTDIDVHHILPYHLKPALELDPNNLIGLCRIHHFVFGHFMNWSAYNPDVWAFVREYRKAFDARPFALAV